MISRLLQNLAVALVYIASGWLSLKVSAPPDYVSLLFIPAGVAVAAILIEGAALLPAIALGSAAVQWMAFAQSGAEHLNWGLLVPPVGAVVQAWCTAHWIERRIGKHSPLDQPREAALVVFLLMPLGSAINASVSVPALLASGVLPADEAIFSWASWWLGDALGVVIVTPILLALFGHPADAWRPRVRTVALPMMMGLALVAFMLQQMRNSNEHAAHDNFEKISQDVAVRLQRRFDAQSDSVIAVAKLMELAKDMRRADFAAMTQPWLQRYAGTQNFGWSPLVGHEARASYERQTHAILGRDPSGQTFPAPEAPVYFPLTWVEPIETNRAALGLDVGVLPSTAQAVQATLRSLRPEVTEAFRLVQESGEQRAVVMYLAVPASDTLSGRQAKGVVSAVFRMDDVVQSVLGVAEPGQPELCLLDVQASVEHRRLSGPVNCEQATGQASRWTIAKPLLFANRHWELRLDAGTGYWSPNQRASIWTTTAAGLVSVALLGAFLIVITGQSRRTRQLVDERTAELARSNATLVELAHFDSLTGLPNRAHWLLRAEAALEAAKQNGKGLAVAFLDIDRFKNVNDSLGHAHGDQLLKSLARRMSACLRERDVLARLGGDEFVALLPASKGRHGATVVASKLVRTIAQPVLLNGQEITATASVGVACYPEDGETIDDLLRHADTAMYAVKSAGRNGWRFFSADMQEHVSRRLTLEIGLRRALAPGNQELSLHYQPQVSARTGRVVGLEALLRWTHPELGSIPPSQFIQVAEDAGLIEPLGRWVLDAACRQIQDWQEGPDAEWMAPLSVSVNISALEFNRPQFPDRLAETLRRYQVPPNRLELEITESLLLQAGNDLTMRLNAIRAQGVRLVLDDFGTGYSSLGYLKRLPLSKLKIDQSFVRDVPGDAEDEAIIRATLSMAHDLGLQVVAEGVETMAQYEFLLRHGCDELQGWLYSRALPAAALPAWLRRQASGTQPEATAQAETPVSG